VYNNTGAVRYSTYGRYGGTTVHTVVEENKDTLLAAVPYMCCTALCNLTFISWVSYETFNKSDTSRALQFMPQHGVPAVSDSARM
jgi:hypothetical protein